MVPPFSFQTFLNVINVLEMRHFLLRRLVGGLAAPAAVTAASAGASVFSFKEDTSKLDKIRQSAKTTKLETSKYFKDTFLIKHSCALSFEAAAGLSTQVYIALEECSQAYTEITGMLLIFSK